MKKKIIIIAGPTGVGKTSVSIELAKRINGEIISCDSMQIYKGMDIGTAKITKEEMQGIPHHLIDILLPYEEFSVSEYEKLSKEIIKKIYLKEKIPVFVGGTGLYINSLVYEMDYGKTSKNTSIREKYVNLYKQYGKEELYKIYEKKSENLNIKEKVHPNNIKRLIRKLEILDNNNVIKDFNSLKKRNLSDINLFILKKNRDDLYRCINKRVDEMIDKGFLDEVANLINKGYGNPNYQSMKAIGYRELLKYFDKKISYDDAIELIKRNSRRYAKRQITWFKKYDFADIIDITNKNTKDVVETIFKKID